MKFSNYKEGALCMRGHVMDASNTYKFTTLAGRCREEQVICKDCIKLLKVQNNTNAQACRKWRLKAR